MNIPEEFETKYVVKNIFQYKGTNTLIKCIFGGLILTYGDPCILEAIARFIINSCS